VSLNVRAIQTDSARLMVSKVFRPEKRYSTTALRGGSGALEAIAAEAAPAVLAELGESWRNRQVVTRVLHLQFSPCSRKQLKAICEGLGQVRGVQTGAEGARIREFVNEVGDVEIDWSYDMDMLANTIEDLEVDGMTFEIVEQTATRLKVKVVGG